jgi:hypothetical protein
MAKVKAARGKKKTAASPRGGLGCVILLGLLMLLALLFLVYWMGHANQT